jgi:hypothetical protein
VKLKVGARYASQACDTEVIVVRTPADDVELTCAGWPMAQGKPAAQARQEPAADRQGGSVLGKRYTDDAGSVELLVVKAGKGTLAIGEQSLEPKSAKALPSSD